MSSITLSPATGTTLGGQIVTIAGAVFGATVGTVKIDGIAAIVGTWSNGSITATIPARRAVNAWGQPFLIVSASPSVVVVTLSDGVTTFTGAYQYLNTIQDLALQQYRAAIATCSVQNGDNYTIGASQVDSMIVDQSASNGAPDPWIIVGRLKADIEPDQPFEFDTATWHCFARGSFAVDGPLDWDYELDALAKDLHAKIRGARQFDGYGLTADVTSISFGQVLGPNNGARAGVQVDFVMKVKTRNTNMNQDV